MQPVSSARRRRLALPAAAAAAAFGLLALPAPPPAAAVPMPGGPVPGIAIVACNLAGDLEAALGDRFGGIWLDVATQHLRVGLLDPADEPAARAVVEACDAKGAAAGRVSLPPSAPNTVYVVVENSMPIMMRAQMGLYHWLESPDGQASRGRIVGYGIGRHATAPGLQLRVTLHRDTTDAELPAIQAGIDAIGAAFGITIPINEARGDFPSFGPLLPGPPPPPLPDPPTNDRSAPTLAKPVLLGRSTVSRRSALSTKRLPVQLRVDAAGSYRVTVRTADRRRTVLARGTASPKQAGRLTVRTRLTKAGRSQLRKARRTAVTVTVQAADESTVTKRIVVR